MENEQLNKNAEQVDWVTLRHKCSPLEVFTELKDGARQDVEVRNKLLKSTDDIRFKVTAHNGKAFSVLCEGDIYGCVRVAWSPAGITVTDCNDKVTYDVTLTLTDDGECKLRLKTGEQLNCWQFRKRILEDLFFNVK